MLQNQIIEIRRRNSERRGSIKPFDENEDNNKNEKIELRRLSLKPRVSKFRRQSLNETNSDFLDDEEIEKNLSAIKEKQESYSRIIDEMVNNESARRRRRSILSNISLDDKIQEFSSDAESNSSDEHEVFDDLDLIVRGIETNDIPKEFKSEIFLKLLKARYGTHPNYKEKISNEKVIAMGKDLANRSNSFIDGRLDDKNDYSNNFTDRNYYNFLHHFHSSTNLEKRSIQRSCGRLGSMTSTNRESFKERRSQKSRSTLEREALMSAVNLFAMNSKDDLAQDLRREANIGFKDYDEQNFFFEEDAQLNLEDFGELPGF